MSPALIRERPSAAPVSDLRFSGPRVFVAGEVHNHEPFWQSMLAESPPKDLFSAIIHNGVNVRDFFCPFKGPFRGESFDSPLPPRMVLPNAKHFAQFQDFISETMLECVQAGSVSLGGKLGECESPHLVTPLTAEP